MATHSGLHFCFGPRNDKMINSYKSMAQSFLQHTELHEPFPVMMVRNMKAGYLSLLLLSFQHYIYSKNRNIFTICLPDMPSERFVSMLHNTLHSERFYVFVH